jgi:glycerol-3-phosphate acyltransferase PlsY
MPVIENTMGLLMLWGLIGYGLGSIPSGIILARLMGLGNLRNIGSGNIGATNVLRTGNKTAAALTLVFDAGKGAAAVGLGRAMGGEDAAQIAGLMAMLGHCYPVWLGFAGGKGVATFLGLALALAPLAGVLSCATWLVAAGTSRMSSMGALAAAGSFTFWLIVTGHGTAFLFGVALTLLIFWRHRGNIARIRVGQEPKIGQNR